MKIRGSLARRAIKQLHQEGKIKLEIQVSFFLETEQYSNCILFLPRSRSWTSKSAPKIVTLIIKHHAQMVYTRAIAVDDAAEEAEAAAAAEAAKGKKGKKK